MLSRAIALFDFRIRYILLNQEGVGRASIFQKNNVERNVIKERNLRGHKGCVLGGMHAVYIVLVFECLKEYAVLTRESAILGVSHSLSPSSESLYWMENLEGGQFCQGFYLAEILSSFLVSESLTK